MKTWSYAAATKEAERRITDIMTQSRQQSKPGEAAATTPLGLCVYLLWSDLILG